ncbi:MAG: cysteine--tRNA ligase, partial [Patescibacteria group bacterium]
MLRIFNTATGKKEEFSPISKKEVGMYSCGLTVYDYAHLGHGRKYVGDDVIRRALSYFGYTVNHVQNVTDVGHLVSDEDEGQDK